MDRHDSVSVGTSYLTARKHAEMYRLLVDAQTGEPLLRRCLTAYISDATYRVLHQRQPLTVFARVRFGGNDPAAAGFAQRC